MEMAAKSRSSTSAESVLRDDYAHCLKLVADVFVREVPGFGMLNSVLECVGS